MWNEGATKSLLHAWSTVSVSSVHFQLLLTLLTSFSVLPAISLNDGILFCKIREGAFRSDSFKDFILGLLDNMQPYPGPNSVIVMDNCKIHKREDILQAISERYVHLWSCLVYSSTEGFYSAVSLTSFFHLIRRTLIQLNWPFPQWNIIWGETGTIWGWPWRISGRERL